MAQEERDKTHQETSYGLPVISEDTSRSLWATYTGPATIAILEHQTMSNRLSSKMNYNV